MSLALDPSAYVYEGFWINWTKDSPHRLTLTLCPASANLLIATLAIFVRMSGGQLWTIIRFTLHQICASPTSQRLSLLHNQQQVVLRNATTDFSTARLLIYLSWPQRKSADKPSPSFWVIFLLAISHAVLFIVAGAFSAVVAKSGETVLSSKSPYCGVFNETYIQVAGSGINAHSTDTFNSSIEFIAKRERDIQLSQEYARNCYMSEDYMSSSSCKTFQKARLNLVTPNKTSCPFDSATCPSDSDTKVFATQWINSRDDLGINAADTDRLAYRRVTTCTVLNDTAYVTGWVNATDTAGAPSSSDIAYANYGSSLIYKTDWTYAYSNFAQSYTNFTGATTTPYQVDAQIAYGDSPNPTPSTFTPIHELTQSNADVVLLFLSYTGRYIAEIDDPWFAAHQIHLANSISTLARTTYLRNRPISTLGCTEQHQVCTNRGQCTPLLGFDQVQHFADITFNLTNNQNVTLDRLMHAVTFSSIREIVEGLATGSTPMLAESYVASESTTLSLQLPPDQWEREVGYWHSVAMAQLQRTFVEFGTGQIAAQTKYLVPPTTDSARWICKNLMIQGTAYQSFSVLALGLIMGFGSLVLLVSLIIESLGSCIQARLHRGTAGREMWDDHDMLGLNLWRKYFEAPPPPPKDYSYCKTRKHRSGS